MSEQLLINPEEQQLGYQQILEQIPDQAMRDKVASSLEGLNLSVAKTEQLPGSVPESPEVTDERVGQHMESIAQQAVDTISEISERPDAQEILSTPGLDIWELVQQRQIAHAQEAKASGDSDRASEILADYLVTGAMRDRRDEKTQDILEKGLASELAMAGQATHGLEAGTESFMESKSIISAPVERIKPIIEILVDKKVSLEPDKPALGEKLAKEELQSKIASLNAGDAVVVATSLSASETHDTQSKEEITDSLTGKALSGVADGMSLISTVGKDIEYPAALEKLAEINPRMSDPNNFVEEFQRIRSYRRVDDPYRINASYIGPVDQAVVELWRSGRKELASRMLTANSAEVPEGEGYSQLGLSTAIADLGLDPEARQQLVREIGDEVARKQQECRQRMTTALMSKDSELTGIADRQKDEESAQIIIERAFKTEDPERASALIEKWAKDADASKILETLDIQIYSGSGYVDILDLLSTKPKTLAGFEDISKVLLSCDDLDRKYKFNINQLIFNSEVFDETPNGRSIRQKLTEIPEKFPIEIFKGQLSDHAIGGILQKACLSSDQEITTNLAKLLEDPAIADLSSVEFPAAGKLLQNLLVEMVDGENSTEFLANNKLRFEEIGAFLSHPLVEKLTAKSSDTTSSRFNAFLLDSLTLTSNPLEATKRLESLYDTQLITSLRSLSEITMTTGMQRIVYDIIQNSDTEKQAYDYEQLGEELAKIQDHPLMQMLKQGGILHNMAPVILESIVQSESMLKSCDMTYAIFSQPQPLWKSLMRFSEMLVNQRIEDLPEAQNQMVKIVPFVRIKKGVRAEGAGLDDVEGFEGKNFAELTVAQKRAMAADGLAEMSDEDVAAMTGLTFDRFAPNVKRAIFAYQIEQTINRSRDEAIKAEADQRNRDLASRGTDVVLSGDLVHATAFESLSSILQDGNVAGEARKDASQADAFPFNVDFGIINGGDSIESRISGTMSFQYYGDNGKAGQDGQIILIYRRDASSWMAGQETAPRDGQRLIFGGIPSTELSGLVLRSPETTMADVSRKIVENGFYIPLYDVQGQLIFTPEQYDAMREDLNMAISIPPEDIIDSSLRTGEQIGSNEGGVYMFSSEAGPVKYYVKFGDNPDHIWTEIAADKLYRAVGVGVPDSRIVSVEGRLGRASRWVESGADLPAGESSTLKDGAAMDMLLANWDVVFNDANTLEIEGVTLRPDSGGALDFRARGEPKTADTWSGVVRELEIGTDDQRLGLGMRQKYPGLTDEELKSQVRVIQERLTDAKIDEIVDSIRRPKEAREALKATLKARRDYMIEKVLT